MTTLPASRVQIIHGALGEAGGKNPGLAIRRPVCDLGWVLCGPEQVTSTLGQSTRDTWHRTVICPLYRKQSFLPQGRTQTDRRTNTTRPFRIRVRTLGPSPGKPLARAAREHLNRGSGRSKGPIWGLRGAERPWGARHLGKSRETDQGGGPGVSTDHFPCKYGIQI